VPAESKEAAKFSCAADRAFISIMAGVWWRRFVVPDYYPRNTKWNLYSSDHGDLWPPEAEHDLDGGR
jgi:hypothetical protein